MIEQGDTAGMGCVVGQLNAGELEQALPQLVALLHDAVESGASIGFLPPLSAEEARTYWERMLRDVDAGSRVMLVARAGERVVGSVQLALETRPNGSHRAEVQKLMVHTTARRSGIGRTLMLSLEDTARHLGRTLLVLDTRAGDAAERLYAKLGYVLAGRIPRYACNADGSLDATAIYYRELPRA
jgi:ribosomal protein S18 acetylase RimI-like enzyme